MRRLRSLVFAAAAGYAACLALPALAQYGGPGSGHGRPQGDDQEAAKKKARDEAFAGPSALPKLANAGPCPFVKSLYDAARYVEFRNGVEASAAVGYTGEIDDVVAGCAYKGAEPIKVRAQILFALGRGPQAEGRSHTYGYWIAVTDRNHAVLDKQSFSLPVTFPAGRDRVLVTETIPSIVIPRATTTVSGGNFEVLIGFDVTPGMAAFNRDGKRFRPNAGETATANQASATP
ncbi:MAG: Tat pathway signal sequence domain protein [Caulobacteraceae bacterium]